MQLHLLSSPGEKDIRYIVNACSPYLQDKVNPTIAYLPLASHANDWLEYTTRQFDGLGIVKKIDTDGMSLDEMKDIISKASVTYISGGNTFLLNHRLHTSGLMPYMYQSVLNGLPFVGFSAGAILCGANILTSEDMNMIETNHFAGLNLSPFNYFVHYPEDNTRREYADSWLEWYHVYHENPVIIMADGSYVKVDGDTTSVIQGDVWVLRKGSQKEKIEKEVQT